MIEPPADFLVRRVHELHEKLGVSGLCVGYEFGAWREDQFVDHALDWLPEFALTWTELEGVNSGNARRLLRRAARAVYTTDKYKSRGEFGELFLHIAVRQFFASIPAISKLYYKDSANDVVKGFDCVHAVRNGDELELWLGEAKFYASIDSAVSAACTSLSEHTNTDFLRAEFAAILNKLDPNVPEADRIRGLLDPNTSLDEIFARIVIPVLLTYDSDTVQAFDRVCDAYIVAFAEEIQANYSTFAERNPLPTVQVHLFLLPLQEKASLVRKLHERLQAWQTV